MPHPKATAVWEMEQEYNIQYVAFTRAKKALYFVGGGAPFTTDGEGDQPSLATKIVCGYCEGEGRELVHQAINSAENIWQDCPICKGTGTSSPEMRDPEEYTTPNEPTPEIRAMAEAAAEKAPPDTIQAIAKGDWLDQFPTDGKFEQNIYRPSAQDFANAMPDWAHAIDSGQLVMEKDLGTGSMVRVYTSVKVGQIAGGVGDDSIRVVRLDTRERDGRVFPFKNSQDWVTREVPKSCKNPESATAHLVGKIQKQIDAFTRDCPECGKMQVKCRAGKGRDSRVWWRGLDCEHSTW